MLLTDITEEIKALPRFEKLQLIEAISKMLLEEENPARYFAAEAVYPVFTPDNQEKAAMQLQQFLKQNLS
ncbi:MAG TPA: hypothetical protein PLD25_10140 [Chloroflexota bacterium]|nr:hypothetical protein [Chloroflexota bacterium]HUM68172.1 hypothetical protein [Chloroflexota bacterium]